MAMSSDDLDKLRSAGVEPEPDPDQQVTAIFRVRTPGYVPRGVDVRSRIDDEMFTGTARASRLEEVRRDENVVSVAAAEPLDLID